METNPFHAILCSVITSDVIKSFDCIYFSESSHVAYQIKADDAGSNMVANILPTDTPLTQGVGSNYIFY